MPNSQLVRLEALTQSKSTGPESTGVIVGNDLRAGERSAAPRAPGLALENYSLTVDLKCIEAECLVHVCAWECVCKGQD